MIKVKSSHLDSVGYDGETKVLEVKFKNGDTYHYSNIDKDAYDSLMAAKSIGKHFTTSIATKHTGKKQKRG